MHMIPCPVEGKIVSPSVRGRSDLHFVLLPILVRIDDTM